MDCVDLKAREDIAKLYTEVRQHSMDYWGPDKQNGIRSEIKEVKEKVTTLTAELKHHLDTRESTCIGIAALDEYLEGKGKEDTEVKVAWINRNGGIVVQMIQLAGIILAVILGATR